jgi:ABC-type nitrate/sulfonate/bicarbonate transport system ATPase subunit
MTYCPGKIKKSVPVELPRPRDISSLSFIALQKELTALVMEEQRRCHDEELHVAECS